MQLEYPPTVQKEYHWKDDLNIQTAQDERITSYRKGFTFVYTYPLTYGFEPVIDFVIQAFYQYFNI